MSNEAKTKSTFEEAYPAAVAKVRSFIEKQKEITSFEFAFMLNHRIIQKVKQGEYMKPPPRTVAANELEVSSEEFKCKEELSTGVSEAGDTEDRGSVSSDSHDSDTLTKNDAILRPQFSEALADCVDHLKSKKSQSRLPICGREIDGFTQRWKDLFELVIQLKGSSSRIHKTQAIVAVLLLAAKQIHLPRKLVTDIIGQHLRTERVLAEVIAVKRSKLFKVLVGKARLLQRKAQEASTLGQRLQWL